MRRHRPPVYAPDPRCWWTFAHGREPNYRNLMIQYGLSDLFTEPAELAGLLDRTPSAGVAAR
ncbi:MAG: Nucleoside 2-deoxyribosyltransferase [Mucilaginibacter sp.]|nr:Nucleoside 2-deoxyribosyltransferase [Mucilaginibacter sp.]